jgi:hypothetical protein
LSISSGGNLLYIPVERETLFRVSLVSFSEEPIDLGPLQYHPSNSSSEVKNDRASCGSPR